jgi:type I restriction enzyme S subunit
VIDLRSFVSTELPRGWRTVPFWSLFKRLKLTGHENEELLSVYRDHGVVPTTSRDDNFNRPSEDLSAYQLVEKGWLVTNKMKAWQGSIAISRFRGIVSPAYYVYRPLRLENDQFLHYLLRSEPYIALYGRISKGVRVNQWDLEHEALRNVPVMLPDIDTQKAIAAFLDRETSRIDKLLEKKQELGQLLAEKLETQTELAITGQGQEGHISAGRSSFVNAIPKGWTETRVRFGIKKIEQGWSPQCEERLASGDEWGVLKLGAITTGKFREEAHKALPAELLPRPEYAVRQGDVLIARASGSPALVGKACFVDVIHGKLMISDKHYRIDLSRDAFNAEFFVYLINSRQSRVQIEMRLSSAEGMARNIGQEAIKNIWCALPNLSTQDQIVREIKRAEVSISAILSPLLSSIDRLRELRSTLITAAVTGQIDVASWRKQIDTDRRVGTTQKSLA